MGTSTGTYTYQNPNGLDNHVVYYADSGDFWWNGINDTLTIQVTDYPDIGQNIAGTFTGTASLNGRGTQNYPISGSFSVPRTQIGETYGN